MPIDKEKKYPEIKARIGKARMEMTRLNARAKSFGISAETSIVFDRTREEIIRYLTARSCDFMVMGTHSPAHEREPIFESNAQTLIRTSPCPVMVVKSSSRTRAFKRIVFASSFDEDVEHPFQKVIEVADLLGAQIHLLFVSIPSHFEASDLTLAKMQAFLENCPRGTCSKHIFNAREYPQGIIRFSKSIDADMIALVTHGHKGVMHILSPSITESVASLAEIPVLSVNFHISGA